MKHIARKRFGQHFLTDRGIIQDIIQAIDPQPGDPMVEIGPGLAAMTQPLVERLGHLTVIELDRDLARQLREHPQLTVVESDVLKVDFRQLAADICRAAHALGSVGANVFLQGSPKEKYTPSGGSEPHAVGSGEAMKLRVVGNLPYNISTPILFHLLDVVEMVEDQHFMLQKEVIDRMVARPSTSDYGRLSVMLQWRYAMTNVLLVPPQSFDPPPRVNSAVVRMVPHAAPAELEVKLLSEVVQVAFSQRRKLLRHTLGRWLETRQFGGAFNVQRRAEEVPVAEYIALVQALEGAGLRATTSGKKAEKLPTAFPD
jgi:16S rRNA (adenine1518-N6/adenine1519-N6)-dimethyltransferase